MWNTGINTELLALELLEQFNLVTSPEKIINLPIFDKLKKNFPNCNDQEIMHIYDLCNQIYKKNNQEKTELVITAPDSFRLKARKIESTLCNLLNNANKSIVFTGYSISEYFEDLLNIIITKSQQGVFVKLFVNDIDRQKESLDRLLAYKGKFLNIYNYQKNDSDKMSALHAKLTIVDQKTSLISSANLSYHGLQGNIEMGVLMNSTEKAKKIESLLDEMLKMHVFTKI